MPSNTINKKDVKPVRVLDGIYRKTLAYNDETMLCFFRLEEGATIPLHQHDATQIGYVMEGKIKFLMENKEFVAEAGDSYVFDSKEKHGAEVLEDTNVIEVFSPCREEYK
jgi:quercetin dioxygenase-like cupin family protein